MKPAKLQVAMSPKAASRKQFDKKRGVQGKFNMRVFEIIINVVGCWYPVTRILARLPRCMGMLAKILARSCQDLTKATMIMQDHGKADHASYQAYQDFPCILPSFSMCLAKHTKIFLSILPIQPGFFHAFCKAFQDFRCNLQSLIRSTCVFEPFEILY